MRVCFHYLKVLFHFAVLLTIKLFCKLAYRFDMSWVSQQGKTNDRINFKDVRLFVLLNHTSLMEPLFIGSFPVSLLWNMSKRMVYPVADKTLKRPLAGLFFKLLAPKTISLTRKRDKSWSKFIDAVKANSLVGIAPEGRMKRLSGLDREGRPMSIKSGIADLLSSVNSGKILFLYSGGLHHIQAPGSGLPKLFKTISGRFEQISIPDYKNSLGKSLSYDEFLQAVKEDLLLRKEVMCNFDPDRKLLTQGH